jgi:2-keto-3-deoxy-L-rhamnonate aldolase RhmA
MRVNHTRERLAKGETVLGCAIQSYRSPEVARTFAEIIDHQNRNILAVVQFETTTAMERADELLSVKGMDIAMGAPPTSRFRSASPARWITRC